MTIADPLFHVVLHEPEIPNNTGNIGRTCLATACNLHLVHPLAFDTSAKALRRAGLDYWPRLSPVEHESWHHAERNIPITSDNSWFFTTRAHRPVWDAPFKPGDRLVFGKETKGLPDDILRQYEGRLLAFPMVPTERSLNLATAVCAAIYEGMRRCVERGFAHTDAQANIILDRHTWPDTPTTTTR